MSNNAVSPALYADFHALAALRQSAKAEAPGALRQAARQFESLFTNMLLKAMRETKLGDGLGDSQETEFYQGMMDQQLAVQLSQGKGLGLADMLVQQLSHAAAKPIPPPAPIPAATPGPPASSPPAASAARRLGFVHQLAPLAERAASQLGVSADTLIAQAALETGWGQHLPTSSTGTSSLNLFGIKAGPRWSGAAVSATTVEVQQGAQQRVAQPFRSYDSPAQSIEDYVALLRTSPRYRQALGSGEDVRAFATALTRGGYATDPDYVNKLSATVSSVRALRDADSTEPLKIMAGQPKSLAAQAS